MTNEEKEALIAQGWTPPVVVDPDIAAANVVVNTMSPPFDLRFRGDAYRVGLAALKRGRELERAEADIEIDQLQQTIMRLTEPKPTPYSVPDGYEIKPHTPFFTLPSGYERKGEMVISGVVQHYAIITPPEDK